MHIPGRSPIAGDYHGPSQVLAFQRRLFELSVGQLEVELHDVLANDDHAVALPTVKAVREERPWLPVDVRRSYWRGEFTEVLFATSTNIRSTTSGPSREL